MTSADLQAAIAHMGAAARAASAGLAASPAAARNAALLSLARRLRAATGPLPAANRRDRDA
ncbi:MAG: hypothetical protein ACXWCC_19345, partial [Caldimonas sp.]